MAMAVIRLEVTQTAASPNYLLMRGTEGGRWAKRGRRGSQEHRDWHRGTHPPGAERPPHPWLLSPGGRGVAVGPILSDSASDIFCGNENSPNFLFHNRGDGTYRDVAAAVGE